MNSEFINNLNSPVSKSIHDGILRCARYAFGPNRLHYCGPDVGHEVAAHLANKAADPNLQHILEQFRTLYPYLNLIAQANHITDPFEERVVEAYWIGNELLETVSRRKLYNLLVQDLHLKQRLNAKTFSQAADTIGRGAVPHHSFHVLDVWRHTGHQDREHTLTTLDECRISWGQVTIVDGPSITVASEPLGYLEGKLFLAPAATRKLVRKLEADYAIEQLKQGDIVTIHWGVPCEVVSPHQAEVLRSYTLRHLKFANQTI